MDYAGRVTLAHAQLLSKIVAWEPFGRRPGETPLPSTEATPSLGPALSRRMDCGIYRLPANCSPEAP